MFGFAIRQQHRIQLYNKHLSKLGWV